jgi:hypothetical protein
MSRESGVGTLSLDDVVDLKNFRLARIDPHLGKDRAQPPSKRLELLLRIPDLADLEVAVRAKAKLIVEPVCWKHTRLREATDNFVVLLCGQRRGREPD